MSSFITELEDWRQFLVERVAEADPTIDTTEGSAFDSAVIQPTLRRLGPDPYQSEVRDFIIGKLQSEFPELSVAAGEPLDDLVVKVMQILLSAYRRQIDQIASNQSFADPETLNEAEADKLGANFFERRRLGGYAVGVARLYFPAPQFVLVTPSNVMSTADGLRFLPVENQAISTDNMLFNVENNNYYFDVVVRAEEEGEDYNIEAGQLNSIDGLPQVVKVANRAEFEEGATKEDTVTFIERIENGLTEKSLVTSRGITSRLLELFETIRFIQVIGYGDPEMERDILEGTSESAPYAMFVGNADTTPIINLETGAPITSPIMGSDGVSYANFVVAGVQVGDIVENSMLTQDKYERYTVTEVIDNENIRITPNPTETIQSKMVLRRPVGGITISEIPGGLLEPALGIEIEDGAVHIGGALDVFIRAGDPQQSDFTIEGALDGSPLHFGVDLESQGDEPDVYVLVTDKFGVAGTPDRDRYGNLVSDEIILSTKIEGTEGNITRWAITEDDVGRYIRLLISGVPGLFEITEILEREFLTTPASFFKSRRMMTRVKINTTNVMSGSVLVYPKILSTSQNGWIVEKISIKDIVRDRDASRVAVAASGPYSAILSGVDFSSVGVNIGDNVVIETSDDAGIYSVRRLLSYLNDNDSILLDRELSTSVVPTGAGDGTGLRYRIADELNIDLVSPRVVKIPLGSIFSGNDLTTVAGSVNVTVTGDTNFLLAGVEAGDTLEVLEGDNIGTYGIITVGGTSLVLDAPMQSGGTNLDFTAYRAAAGVNRPLVRVKEVELLDSSSQPTGITIPYGKHIDARVLGQFSNRAEGNVVESFTGQTSVGTTFTDNDPDIDFTVDVRPGYRLNVISKSSVGEYTIKTVAANTLEVEPAVDGGEEFVAAETGVHYYIGLPSAGFLRLYFLNPTSVNIRTGLAGGRIRADVAGLPEFRFSEVDGYQLIPFGGDETDEGRDLRVVNSIGTTGGDLGPPYLTVLEFTDPNRPDVFKLELLEGDTLEINKQISFDTVVAAPNQYNWDGTTIVNVGDNDHLRAGYYIRENADGQWFKVASLSGGTDAIIENPLGLTIPNTGLADSSIRASLDSFGVFSGAPGLVTVAGSSRVSVPSNSLIDFVAMNFGDALLGQILTIDDGPDAGTYLIEEVINSKTLRLNAIMASSTTSIQNVSPARDAYLENISASEMYLNDPSSGSAMPSVQGTYATLFETLRAELSGTFEVSEITNPGEKVKLDTAGFDFTNPAGERTFQSGSQNTGVTGGALAEMDDASAQFRTDEVIPGDVLVITGGTSGAAVGRYQVLDVPSETKLTLDSVPPADTAITYKVEDANYGTDLSIGRLSWVWTESENDIFRTFHIYERVPFEAEIVQVGSRSTERDAVLPSTRRGHIQSDQLTMIDDDSSLPSNIEPGDILEVLTGPSRGMYFIETDNNPTDVVIHNNPANKFVGAETNVPYRIWAGVRGSKRMITVGEKGAFNGLIQIGERMPYAIRRAGVQRLSSTEMRDNEEGGLYYVDVQVESMGSGDVLNLERGTRFIIDSGLEVDGYTYTVENNRLTFSPFEEVSLNFDRRFLPVGNSDSPENTTEVSGRNLKVVYETSTIVRLVNDLLRSDNERPVTANPIARHFLPSYVITEILYRGGVSADIVGQEIEDYINTLGGESELEVSDLEAFATRRGADSVEHPLELVAVTHDIDRELVVDRTDNSLGGLNDTAFNGTGRIAAFFAILGEGLTVERES